MAIVKMRGQRAEGQPCQETIPLLSSTTTLTSFISATAPPLPGTSMGTISQSTRPAGARGKVKRISWYASCVPTVHALTAAWQGQLGSCMLHEHTSIPSGTGCNPASPAATAARARSTEEMACSSCASRPMPSRSAHISAQGQQLWRANQREADTKVRLPVQGFL